MVSASCWIVSVQSHHASFDRRTTITQTNITRILHSGVVSAKRQQHTNEKCFYIGATTMGSARDWSIQTVKTQARFPFKRNCLRCVNENRKKHKGKQTIMVATALTEHSYCVALTQAPANRNARSKQWQP